ncbi:MAG: hypothetical protein GF347_05605 [Candidatus Moranbacteria bacterium]|nr:hypothetical protein [Candidatus Moranbacteria bacterium]
MTKDFIQEIDLGVVEKKKKKGLSFWIVIVLILFLVSGLVGLFIHDFLFYRHLQDALLEIKE